MKAVLLFLVVRSNPRKIAFLVRIIIFFQIIVATVGGEPQDNGGGGFVFGARNAGGIGDNTNYFINVWAGASK